MKHQHKLMERIWSSSEISLEKKNALMDQLEAADKSDWLQNTKAFCEAAHPDNKDKMWNIYFSDEPANWGLN